MDWQPIETAPNDGTCVLVYFRGVGPLVAFTTFPDVWTRYLGFGKTPFWPDISADYATHWMPLPDPPAQAEGSEWMEKSEAVKG